MPGGCCNSLTMGFAERRKHPRVPAALAVRMSLGPKTFSARTRNISCGGTLFRVAHRIPLMTRLDITLKLSDFQSQTPALPIRCQGVVVRRQGFKSGGESSGYLTAIYFSQIKRIDRRRIAEFVLQSMLSHGHRRS